jgi:biopolymer transport protein ExbB
MLSQIFLGISMIGGEWVLYLLVLLSVISVAIMFERAKFYREATRGGAEFRKSIREAATSGNWEAARRIAEDRAKSGEGTANLEAEVAAALLARTSSQKLSTDVLTEVAQDAVVRARLHWERNLAALATIGNNAPFIGLFGTVMGIMRAFHDLANVGSGVNTVSVGISEALVTTAVGILVAIPAVAAFNLFQRRVKAGVAQAESMKCFLIGRMAG